MTPTLLISAFAQTSADESTNPVKTTQEVSQHFAEISQTDPWAAFCFVVGLFSIGLIIVSFISPRLKSKVPALASMGGRFLLLMMGGFFLMLPIAMHLPASDGIGMMWPYWYQSIPAAFFLMFNTLGFSANLVLWTPVIHTIMGYSVLANLYFWLIVFYIVASPVMLALTAADVIVNGLTGIIITVQSWCKALFSRPIYVFSGADQNTLTLAKNLLHHLKKTKDKTRPLLIFADVVGDEDARQKMLLQEVKELSYNAATLTTTPLSSTSIPAHLAHLVRGRSQVTYCMISEDSVQNVRQTQALLSTAMKRIERYEKRAKKKGAKRGYSTKTLSYAAKVKMWCLDSANQDFSLLFDEKRKAYLNLLEVNVLNSARDVIWDCFLHHPLTHVLESIDMSGAAAIPSQELTIIVATCDAAGIQALLAASWFGVLPGVKLHLVGVGDDVKATLSKLAVQAPDFLKSNDFFMIDSTFSTQNFYSFVEGQEVEGYTLSQNSVTKETRKLSDKTNVYCLLVNEAQNASLTCALHVMRAAEKRIFSLKEEAEEKKRSSRLPKVLIMLESSEDEQDIVVEPKDKTESQALVQMKTFGSKKDQFSYAKIIEGRAVKVALKVQKQMKQQVAKDDLDVRVQSEPLATNKETLLSTAYYAPSLLWAIGIDYWSAKGQKTLKIEIAQKLYGGVKPKKELSERIAFNNVALTEKGSEARYAELSREEEKRAKEAPVVVSLADCERRRMAAFLRAHGWTACEGGLQELIDLNAFFGINDGVDKFPSPNIAQTKQDYLLVDDIETYFRRSAACGCDSPAYDRARVLYTLQALVKEP